MVVVNGEPALVLAVKLEDELEQRTFLKQLVRYLVLYLGDDLEKLCTTHLRVPKHVFKSICQS